MIETYNRLYVNHDKKILYIKHNSSFDLVMKEVFPNMIFIDSINNINHYFTFTSVIYNNLFDLQYSATEPLSYAKHSSLCFIHEFIALQNNFPKIKKILQENLEMDIINCDNQNYQHLGSHIQYGIPYHDIVNDTNSEKILIIGNREGLQNLSKFLKQRRLKFDIVDKFSEFKDYNEFLNFVKKYRAVCSYNNIDLCIAASLGCSTINLNKVIDAQGLLQVLSHCLQNPPKANRDILLNLNFHMFKKDILNANNIKALM
tara:strand:+ start:4323 stop:5099 length:777 start_codon:yes stop_codon:yes gene_type:complete